MTARALLFSVLVGPLAACSQATTAGTPTNDDAALQATGRRFMSAIDAKDPVAIVSFYAADARVSPPNAPPATGTAAIQGMWREVLAIPNFQLVTTPTSREIAAAGDMALEHGTYRFSADGPGGRETDEGKYAVTWRKVAGEWKIASEIWNTSRPRPTPAPAAAAAPVSADGSEMEILAISGLKWAPLEIPGFKPGVEITTIHGNPTKDGDYTIRLRFPSGYQFPSHWHPNGEHLTVIRGTFRLGMGEKENPALLKTYTTGDFLYIPPKMAHFGGVQGTTEVQLHGMGPFQVVLATQP